MEFRCGKCFEDKPAAAFYFSKGKRNAWCKVCYRAWYAARSGGLVDRKCDGCGTGMTVTKRRASEERVYCSRKCKADHRNDRRAAERLASKPLDRECLHCAVLLPQRMRAEAIFCSEECNSRAHALQRKLRMRTGQDNKPGYLRAAICKRDGWRCGICKERVSPKLEHPNPRCASLDHIIPVSRGGESEPVNLRLVHLVCNLRRRNLGGVEQLAMFG